MPRNLPSFPPKMNFLDRTLKKGCVFWRGWDGFVSKFTKMDLAMHTYIYVNMEVGRKGCVFFGEMYGGMRLGWLYLLNGQQGEYDLYCL